MRILGAVVLPPTALMAGASTKIMGGGAIRAQIVRDQSIRDEPAFLQEFAHQFQRGMLVRLNWTSTSRTSLSASAAGHR
jgi:hypothetical protein